MRYNDWIMKQSWEDLVFMHWPVPPQILRPFIPSQFEIDLYDGMAWIAIVPFHMNDIQLRGFSAIPVRNHMLELNVRTYVRYNNESGVYFISLDANHRLGVFLARSLFGLPYLNASMRTVKHNDHFAFLSRRDHKGYEPAQFHSRIHVKETLPPSKQGSLAYWLTERYALWIVRGANVYKGPILHHHWELQNAEVEIEINDLLNFLPAHIYTQDPVTHYSKFLKTSIFPFEKQT